MITAHLEAIVGAAPGGIAAVVLTHRHLDHAESAAELARRGRVRRTGGGPGPPGRGPDGLDDGDRLEVAGATLTAVATPGHTSDSVSLLVAGDDGVVRLLTGDMVLGRGTTVITHPDGDLAAYLDSLARLRELVLSARDQPRSCPVTGRWSPTRPAGWPTTTSTGWSGWTRCGRR